MSEETRETYKIMCIACRKFYGSDVFAAPQYYGDLCMHCVTAEFMARAQKKGGRR